MSAINTKSTKSVILAAYNDLARELELTKRQLADAMTEKGVLLNQLATARQESEHFEVEAGQALQALEAANQVRADLQDERDALAMMDCIPQQLQESYAALVDERNELIAENQRLVEAAIAVTEELDAAKEHINGFESEVEVLKQSYDDVESQLIAAEAQIKRQGQVIAAQPKSAPRMTVAATVVESQAPVIQITDHDKAVYAKFQALPREQKQAYYDFAHSNGFGHLGIHNVNAIRVAFLAAKAA